MTNTKLVILALLTMSLYGCGEMLLLSHEVPRQLLGINVKRIGIYDLNSKEWTSFRTNDKIIRINEAATAFQTLGCVDPGPDNKCKSLRLKSVSYNGQTISEVEFPALFQPHAMYDFAISPDSTFLAYYTYSTKSLHVYDSHTSSESILFDNIASTGLSIRGIQWVSGTELILMLADDKEIGRSENKIIRIDVSSKTVRTLGKPVYLSFFNWTFSKDFTYLAYWEGYREHTVGSIRIIDTETGRNVATIHGDKELISGPCWSPDGHSVAYFKGKGIQVFSLDSNQSRQVKSLHDNQVGYNLTFLDKNSLLYGEQIFDAMSIDKTLHIIDITTGEEKNKIGPVVIGKIFVVDNGKKIIAETGY